jgi:hypothetical protein
MPDTKTYILNKTQQLIDLNGDITNFDLKFTATTKDNSPFQIVVADQTTLDNSNLDFKDATSGTISGNIVADKNVYQNYYLILKAENQCECDVTIDITKINPKNNQPNQLNQPSNNVAIPATKKQSINWKIVIVIIVVILGAIFLYYTFYYNSQENSQEDIPEDIMSSYTNMLNSNLTRSSSQSDVSSQHSSPQSMSQDHSNIRSPVKCSPGYDNDLVSQLNSLNI